MRVTASRMDGSAAGRLVPFRNRLPRILLRKPLSFPFPLPIFIAHQPAGYLLAKTIFSRTLGARAVMAAGLLGSITPDPDLLYFYTLERGNSTTNSYWTHYPDVWLALMLAAWGISHLKRWRAGGTWLPVFSGSGFLHILLDGIVGDIPLFAPWSMRFYALAEVPARLNPWWLNFLMHWSFLLELLNVRRRRYIFNQKEKERYLPFFHPPEKSVKKGKIYAA